MPGSFECGFKAMGEGFRTHHPGITLMDLQMPRDAIGANRREFPEVRIIVLTAYSADAQVVAMALKRGIIELEPKGAPIKGLW